MKELVEKINAEIALFQENANLQVETVRYQGHRALFDGRPYPRACRSS